MQTKDYLETLENQISETENLSSLFGSISIVNSKLISHLVKELKAARKVVENLRLFFCSNHEEIIDQTCAVCLNSPNGETCAEALLTKIQEYDEVKNANT